jgi:hypothetical protein
MLGRVMLLNTEFAAIWGSDEGPAAPGLTADSRVVRWIRRGDQVHLELTQFERRAGDTPDLRLAVEEVSLGYLIKSFDVIGEGQDGAPIIERAGFKNAITAVDAPTKAEDPSWDPEDARYSVIRMDAKRASECDGPEPGGPAQRRGDLVPRDPMAQHPQAGGDPVLHPGGAAGFSRAPAPSPR